MSKTIVFIDGNNFYFRMKDLTSDINGRYSLLDFNYQGFAKSLISAENQLLDMRYYIGALKRQKRNEKSEKLYANQQKLIAKLQQKQTVVVLGHLIQHPDKSFHEKGVDVRIAVEMIRFAREDKYDIAYLLSSDTDLVPAVEEVQSFGKMVVYVGTAKSQSFGLTKQADDTILLRPENIKNFLPTTLL